MEKFIVSARKYRPQNFSTVVGQAHITTTLKNAITNNQLAHAFLFTGPRGVGKTTCARILAKTINCENQTKEGEACNTCQSCVSFDAGSSMNIHELDAASNNSVDDIRSLVDQVRFAPQAGKYKVYIVDEVHMLSTSAFNAFLKTLEEPPPFVIFILATTEKHKILPTILSRCQIFDFKRITNADTVLHLQEICDKEDIKAEKTALHIIAQKSEGCMRDSLSILDKIVSFTNGQLTYSNTLAHLNILDEDYYFKLLHFMQNQQLADALLLFDEINAKGFEGDTFLEGYAEFIRNVLVSRDARAAILLQVADDFKEKYVEAAQKVNVAWLVAALNSLNETEINYKQARNKRLHIEFAIIKLTHLSQAIELTTENGELVKKKLTEVIKVVNFKAIQPIRILKNEVENKIQPQLKQEEPQAKLSIESADEKIKPLVKTNTTLPKVGLSSLEKIRKKIADQSTGQVVKLPLTNNELSQAWSVFTQQLEDRKNHSAVTNFKMARLNIVNNDSIEIVTENNIQQKFIEQERALLIEHLQNHFGNKALTYNVIIVETEASSQPIDKPLNTKEQYLKIIEEYPLVKELKDRLRLELDY